jgi:hypothetical protein
MEEANSAMTLIVNAMKALDTIKLDINIATSDEELLHSDIGKVQGILQQAVDKLAGGAA